MGILQYPQVLAGQAGVVGAIKYMVTTDNLATIETAGYLNNPDLAVFPIAASDNISCLYSFNTQTNAGTWGLFTVSISNGVITMVPSSAGGDVLIPTIANHIATYTNTSGQLSEDPATAISGGNIQAGLSGTAGYLASFPGTASKGSLRFQAVANTGNTVTTISNAAMGQASTISVPDPGTSTSNFILSTSGSPQNIAGGLTISTGNLNVTAGNVVAGSSGNAGTVSSFPTTASKGSLVLAAVANSGNTTTTISNAAMGQASVISIPDPAGATADFLLAPAALVNNNLVKASGTAGLVADAGIAAANVMSISATNTMQASSNIILDKSTATTTGGAAEIDKQSGVLTTESLTTAGGSTYVITLTNSKIASTSIITTSVMGGTNTVQDFRITATPGSGSATITIYNLTAATAFDGTIIFGFVVW